MSGQDESDLYERVDCHEQNEDRFCYCLKPG